MDIEAAFLFIIIAWEKKLQPVHFTSKCSVWEALRGEWHPGTPFRSRGRVWGVGSPVLASAEHELPGHALAEARGRVHRFLPRYVLALISRLSPWRGSRRCFEFVLNCGFSASRLLIRSGSPTGIMWGPPLNWWGKLIFRSFIKGSLRNQRHDDQPCRKRLETSGQWAKPYY